MFGYREGRLETESAAQDTSDNVSAFTKEVEQLVATNKIPRHVAVIMDGNGRWAKQRGLKRAEGHRAGAKSVRLIIEECGRLGIEFLTLYSFSTQNWKREASEIAALMDLFLEHLKTELPNLCRHGVRLRAIGELDRLPLAVRRALAKNIDETKDNSRLNLTLALSYSSRDELVAAARSIALDAKVGKLSPEEITEERFSEYLWTSSLPEPDLLIRTSGEQRISNFLLWQLAYSELVFIPEHWPDFTREVFHRCLMDYALRERRFGLSSEQLQREAEKNA